MAVNQLEPVVPNPQGDASTAQPTPAPLQAKYGGDWTKANEGYFEVVNVLKNERAEKSAAQQALQQKDERIRQLESAVAQSLGVAAPAAVSNDPLAPLQTELGLPIQPFRDGIRSEVAAVVEELFKPIIQNAQAEESLASEIENFSQVKGQAQKFMAENPEVAGLFNAVRGTDPVRAWKYAIREMVLARNATPAPIPPRAAGLPGSSTPTGRAPVNPAGPSQAEKETAAWDYHKQYGDWRPAVHERLKDTSVERHVQNTLRQMGLLPPEEGGNIRGW